MLMKGTTPKTGAVPVRMLWPLFDYWHRIASAGLKVTLRRWGVKTHTGGDCVVAKKERVFCVHEARGSPSVLYT